MKKGDRYFFQSPFPPADNLLSKVCDLSIAVPVAFALSLVLVVLSSHVHPVPASVLLSVFALEVVEFQIFACFFVLYQY